jgi:hypothetical protein
MTSTVHLSLINPSFFNDNKIQIVPPCLPGPKKRKHDDVRSDMTNIYLKICKSYIYNDDTYDQMDTCNEMFKISHKIENNGNVIKMFREI